MLGIGVFLLSIAFVTAVRVPMGMRAPPVPKDTVLPSECYYTQKLDHFNDSDTTTWQQRYFVENSSWTPTGPVFLMLGAEGPADPGWLVGNNQMMRNAKIYGAMAILLEHRYYGKSLPTPDTSLPNLKYLSSQQALVDAIDFIISTTTKYKMSSSNKWVVFGGSYAGSLAAWMRKYFSQSVVGAVASSGPALAELNFYRYLEVVKTSLDVTEQGAQCNENIQVAFTELDKMLQDVSAWPTVEELFSVNPALRSMDDARYLAQNLINVISHVVQNNKLFEGDFTTDNVCNIMCDESKGTPLQRLAAFNFLYLKKEGQNTTYASHSGFINWMKMSGWNDLYVTNGIRQWYYQMCKEFGYFTTTDSYNQPFGNLVNLDFLTKVCYDVFKIKQSEVCEAVTITNNYYRITTNETNIVFPNGSIDPWHALGITQNITDQLPAIFIEGTAHCADMYPPKSSDLPGLTNAREEITTLIGTWLMV